MQEIVDVLDAFGNTTGTTLPKDEVHTKEIWHRGAHIWIYNRRGEMLLQRRSLDKAIYPDTWDISAAGHVQAGESPAKAALRETHEELGIALQPDELIFIGVTRSEQLIPKAGYIHRVFDWNFIVERNVATSQLRLDLTEVVAARWITLANLRKELQDVRMRKEYSPRPLYCYDMAITEIRTRL